MSVLLFDPETPTDLAQWQPAISEPSDIALQLNATTPAEAATLPPLDFVSSSDYGLTREPVGSLLVDTVGDDMAALFGDPRDIEAQMRNAVYLSQEEAVPLSVMVPLLPLYQQKYSQELYGESFQSPVRFLEKTQQPVTDKQARYLTLTPSQRVEQKKEEYNIILGQPGYGIEPPELSPDGLSIEARQKQIDELKANKQPETLSPGLGGAYMPGVALQNRAPVENMEARQALHLAKAAHWREQLITPQNITSRAIQEVSAQERVVDQTISNRGFQTWARDYHGVNVGDPVERIGGGSGSFLTDPGTRRLAEEYLLTRPGSGEILWDTLARSAKGAIANVGGRASGGLGVAFSAAGFENVGQALTDVADWTQMEARNSTDLRLDGTAPAVVAEGLGELATYALTGSAVAGLSRAAGLGERGIAISTTMATGSLGGADNAYTLYQEARAAGASEENARLAAGWGFVGGVTTAIPVTQWALRIERGAEVFVPLSRMTLEATEAGLQNTTLQLTNNFAAQQIYDQNRDTLENVVGSLALGAGTGGIISLLSSVVAHARGKRSARGVENDDSPKSGENSNNSGSTSGDAPPENTGSASLESKLDPEENPYRDVNGKLRMPKHSRSEDPALKEYSAKLRQIADNQEMADRLYDAILDAKGGKVIGTDIARELLPEYASGREGKIVYGNATGHVSPYYAKDRLWREINNRGERKTLLFTAGGVAAGKSSAISDNVISKFDLVFDGTLRDSKWAIAMISMAEAQGWKVRVDYVQRPIELVIPGAVSRANKIGRWGPIAELPENHETAQASIIHIAKAFADNKNIGFQYWLNDGLTDERPPHRIALEEIDNGGKYSYSKDYGMDERRDGRDRRGDDRKLEGNSKAIPERRRRAAEAFRGAVESGKYEERILRLLVKGSPEYERILDNSLIRLRDPY